MTVKLNVACRKSMMLFVDRILGTILAAWAKRRQLGEMKKTLDLMQRLGVKTRERDLKFVRMLVDKGKFKHEWLPADPMAEVKKVSAPMRWSQR